MSKFFQFLLCWGWIIPPLYVLMIAMIIILAVSGAVVGLLFSLFGATEITLTSPLEIFFQRKK
jgi:hypothetical protein